MDKVVIHLYGATYPWYDPRSIIRSKIRRRLNSAYHHISLELRRGARNKLIGIFESKMMKGVVVNKWHLAHPTMSIEIPIVEGMNIDGMHHYLVSKIGSKYDFLAILGFLTATKRQSDDNFFCSEYVNKALDILLGYTLGIDTLVSPKDVMIRVISHLACRETDT